MKRNDIKAGEVYQYERGTPLYGRAFYKALVLDTEPVHRATYGTWVNNTSDRADGLRVVFLPVEGRRPSIGRGYAPHIPVAKKPYSSLFDGTDAEGRTIYRIRPSDLKQTWAEFEAEQAREQQAFDQAKAEAEARKAKTQARLDALPSDLRTFFGINDAGAPYVVVHGVAGAKGLLDAIERNLIVPKETDDE